MNDCDPQYTNLPNVWRAMMKVNGISAREVAMRLKVNLSHFYNVLNGKASPTLEYAQKIETMICSIIVERKVGSRTNIANGDSTDETSGNTQQRTDGGLPSESLAQAEL
jgi:transcriptional regulator with XRE-family HTH domain